MGKTHQPKKSIRIKGAYHFDVSLEYDGEELYPPEEMIENILADFDDNITSNEDSLINLTSSIEDFEVAIIEEY